MATLHWSDEAAVTIGCSKAYVQRLAKRHGIGQKKGGVWLFTAADVRRLQKRAQPPGQPPKRRRK